MSQTHPTKGQPTRRAERAVPAAAPTVPTVPVAPVAPTVPAAANRRRQAGTSWAWSDMVLPLVVVLFLLAAVVGAVGLTYVAL